MKISDIPLRKRNAIKARLLSCFEKHGYEETRWIAMRYFEKHRAEKKLEEEIKKKEEQLQELKTQAQK